MSVYAYVAVSGQKIVETAPNNVCLNLCGVSPRWRVYIDGKAPGLWWYEWPRTDLWPLSTLPQTVNKWFLKPLSQRINVLNKASRSHREQSAIDSLQYSDTMTDTVNVARALFHPVSFVIQDQVWVKSDWGATVSAKVRLNIVCRTVK